MTTIARIVERYDIPLPPGPPALKGGWYLDHVLREPKRVGRNRTASWLVLRSLVGPRYNSVWEPFGGIGAGAVMVEDLFKPSYHVVGEIVPEAVDHLHYVLPANVQVRLADAYRPEEFVPADMIVADFGDLTVWRVRPGGPARALLDHMFGSNPKAVVITDIACRYLHLHRQRYETVLGAGRASDYPSYLKALSEWLEDQYGYRFWSGRYDHRSSVLSFVQPGLTKELYGPLGVFEPTPDSPVGIELV